MSKRLINWVLNKVGFELDRYPSVVSELDDAIISKVLPYTMTHVKRLIALIDSVRYISRNQLPGDIVECGVWRGGSMMAAALTLLSEMDTSRRLFLYDTFDGMTQPTEEDLSCSGLPAEKVMQAMVSRGRKWCYAGLADVKSNLASTGYPFDRINFVCGKVEDTIPGVIPEEISILRLDTDWYESTKHELVQLYPRLVHHGVLIVDDYGYWKGAKKAVDEFLSNTKQRPLLQRIDSAGRLLIKTGP